MKRQLLVSLCDARFGIVESSFLTMHSMSTTPLTDWFDRLWSVPSDQLPALCRELEDAQIASDSELNAAIRAHPTGSPDLEVRSGQVLWELFQDHSLFEEAILRNASGATADELRDWLSGYPDDESRLGRLLMRLDATCPGPARAYLQDEGGRLVLEELRAGSGVEEWLVSLMRENETSPLFDSLLSAMARRCGTLAGQGPIACYLSELRHKNRGWLLAGCVLCKISSRSNRVWLKRIIRGDPEPANWSDEDWLVQEVLCDLVPHHPLATEALVLLPKREEHLFRDGFSDVVSKLGQFGLRGWATLARLHSVCGSVERRLILLHASESSRLAQAFLPLARVSLHKQLAAKLNEPPFFEEEAQDELDAVFRLIQVAGSAGRALAPDLLQLLKAFPLNDDMPFEVIVRCLETLQQIEANDPMTLGAMRTLLDTAIRDGDDLSRPFQQVTHAFLALNPNVVLQELRHPRHDGRLFDHLQSRYPLVRLPDAVRESIASRTAELLLYPNLEVGQRAATLLAHHPTHAPRLVPHLVAACCSTNEQIIERVSKIVLEGDARARMVASLISRMEGTDPSMALRAAVGLWFLNQHRPIFEMLMRELSRSEDGLPRAFLDWHQRHGRPITAVSATLRSSLGAWIDLDPERQRFLLTLGQRLLEPQLALLWKQLQSPDADRAAVIARACELLPGTDDLLGCLARLILGSIVGPEERRLFGTLHPVKYFIRRDNSDIAAGKVKRDAVYEVLLQPVSAERSRALTAAVFGDVSVIHPDVHGLLTHPFSWLRWVGLTLLEGYPLAANELRKRVEPFAADPSEMVREKAKAVLTKTE